MPTKNGVISRRPTPRGSASASAESSRALGSSSQSARGCAGGFGAQTTLGVEQSIRVVDPEQLSLGLELV